MKVWYGVQGAANSRQVVRYVTATAINGVGAPEWSNVISVRVCLLMRSSEPVLTGEDTLTYLDCDSATQTSNDHYLRRAYFTTSALRSKMAF
jgi:type IV pilus assembly protein PilW